MTGPIGADAMMTSTTRPRAARVMPVFGAHGQALALVSLARLAYLSSLLAECELGHCYILPDNLAAWLATDAVCPRCRLLGLA